jgi:hypothetical protein
MCCYVVCMFGCIYIYIYIVFVDAYLALHDVEIFNLGDVVQRRQ